MEDLVKILTDSSIIVQRIAVLLEEKHISTFIKDNVESARVAGFGVPQNSVDLYVDASDVESAQKLVAGLRSDEAV
jgi:hypothetical protein